MRREQCYTVTTELTAEDLGLAPPARAPSPASRSTSPGAKLKITVLVEKDLPYHLAEVTAVLTLPTAMPSRPS